MPCAFTTMLPSIFRVYLLNRTAVSIELSEGVTARDVCLQIKRRLAVDNDADYGLFGTSADPSAHHTRTPHTHTHSHANTRTRAHKVSSLTLCVV